MHLKYDSTVLNKMASPKFEKNVKRHKIKQFNTEATLGGKKVWSEEIMVSFYFNVTTLCPPSSFSFDLTGMNL